MTEEHTPRTIKAVERASTIIHLLEDEGKMTLTEIANELDVSKSTVHTYLRTLSQEGFLARTSDTYRLSLRHLSLSERVKNRISIYDDMKHEVDALAEKTDERAQFAKLEEDMVVFIYRAMSENAIPTTLSLGEYVYPHSVAAGKAMIAYLPDHRVNEIVERNGLPKQTENTVTDLDELKRRLDKVRERGYAFSDGERLRGVRCIGTPIRDDSGRVLGAISVSGPARRMTDERIDTELEDMLLESANVIEVNVKLS
ncbi:IclR family transcriptional regulator [Haloglomus halophilum]|uniref:IclR family transcriptional regulator n=1 Tax=Haloglomus halophilum TaxID=2962672 RepID=UPI0020CA165F|nr:IclR family transcriptional regulator [Haloglomus halophilum]